MSKVADEMLSLMVAHIDKMYDALFSLIQHVRENKDRFDDKAGVLAWQKIQYSTKSLVKMTEIEIEPSDELQQNIDEMKDLIEEFEKEKKMTVPMALDEKEDELMELYMEVLKSIRQGRHKYEELEDNLNELIDG